MGIYTAPGVLAYVSNGSTLKTSLTLSSGTYYTTVEEWDYCGGASTTPIKITVTSSGKSFAHLEQSGGWSGYGQRAPDFVDCSPSPCKNIVFTMTKGVTSPSIGGNSAAYYLAGSQAYGDTLWNNHLIGDLSSQGLPDSNHTLVPTFHNFTYDVSFWMSNPGASEALEFDINQFVNGKSYIWGHECRIAGGNEWDVWDNPGQKWHPTGVACHPLNNQWNHLTIQVQRTSDGHLLFQSITLNGKTATLNRYDTPTSTSWSGITVNYQQDGNEKQQPYSIWLDKFNFHYW